jgi:hypothetical protein
LENPVIEIITANMAIVANVIIILKHDVVKTSYYYSYMELENKSNTYMILRMNDLGGYLR